MPINRFNRRYQKYFNLFFVGIFLFPAILFGDAYVAQKNTNQIKVNTVTQPKGAHVTIPISNTTFGFSGTSEYGYGICGDDNVLYACGSIFNFTSNRVALIATKWDHDLNLIWNRTVEWGDELNGMDIAIIGENLYLIGYAVNYTTHEYPIFLSQWDTAGNPIKISFVSFPNVVSTIERMEFHDNLIYTSGSVYNYTANYYDLLLVCWDLAGNIVWNRTWGYEAEYELAEIAYNLCFDTDSIYTCGKTNVPGKTGYDLLLIKWDLQGNEIWNRTWGTELQEYGSGVWVSTNAIYTVGTIINVIKFMTYFTLIKWDLTGNALWNITFSNVSSNGNDIWGLDDDSLYALGTQNVPGYNHQVLLMQFDSSGNYSITLYGGLDLDLASELCGVYPYLYSIGATQSYGAGEMDFFLVKFKITTDTTITTTDTTQKKIPGFIGISFVTLSIILLIYRILEKKIKKFKNS